MADVLRDARLADLPAILALAERSFVDAWSLAMLRDELDLPRSHMLLLEDRDPLGHREAELVGFSLFWLVLDELHLMQLAVAPQRRKQGLGRKLLDGLLERGRAAGATRALLEVRASNEAALGLYLGFGFEQIGARKAYYASPTEDALVLEYLYPSTDLSLRS